jgi:hypothetical protein
MNTTVFDSAIYACFVPSVLGNLPRPRGAAPPGRAGRR